MTGRRHAPEDGARYDDRRVGGGGPSSGSTELGTATLTSAITLCVSHAPRRSSRAITPGGSSSLVQIDAAHALWTEVACRPGTRQTAPAAIAT
jgi:hypothetical protein